MRNNLLKELKKVLHSLIPKLDLFEFVLAFVELLEVHKACFDRIGHLVLHKAGIHLNVNIQGMKDDLLKVVSQELTFYLVLFKNLINKCL